MPMRRDVVLLQVPELRLGEPVLANLAVRDLDGVVAVDVGLLDRDHRTGAGLDHGDRGHLTGLLIEDLGHAQLLSDNALHSLISMSTPAGRSNRISESTVFGVGEWMSISRLWVRISNASRESLSLKGLRMTVYTFFSVGRGTGPVIVAPVRWAVSTID